MRSLRKFGPLRCPQGNTCALAKRNHVFRLDLSLNLSLDLKDKLKFFKVFRSRGIHFDSIRGKTCFYNDVFRLDLHLNFTLLSLDLKDKLKFFKVFRS